MATSNRTVIPDFGIIKTVAARFPAMESIATIAAETKTTAIAETEEQETMRKLVHPDKPLSERSDKISLLSASETSEAETRLQTQLDINTTWKRIEVLMTDEASNAWKLGDEFLALSGMARITIREMADKVQRGKSFVDSLISTAKGFPPEKRVRGYTWFAHDVHRRAISKVREGMKAADISVENPGLTAEAYMVEERKAKARTATDAANAILKLLHEKQRLTKEQFTKLTTKETARELQLYVRAEHIQNGLRICFIEMRERPEKGKDFYNGMKFTKLAWRKLYSADAEVPVTRMLCVPIDDDGKPTIDEAVAQWLLDCVKGDEKALNLLRRKTPAKGEEPKTEETEQPKEEQTPTATPAITPVKVKVKKK